jgi:hypothetical protein
MEATVFFRAEAAKRYRSHVCASFRHENITHRLVDVRGRAVRRS